ncbi:methyltransferase family protein [Halohasta litchfieldiae]|jgi:ubiquinone/menaquinone biosynthesis C-methylase UbiE|uniref:Methyltransferase domain-containing protein n=1 Tax=Halohasta litchfieldiae TaxID=1073996 RepID=A0A1H6SH40_9EURY|nr:methyltransferase domain-containing protein [Halohasta litchfieldiae]ATW87894.1 methyltransferase family protein [Halohasta litchfieldiae]SEI62742.1 Methyltransferase domain-containing protein [Halohasta litchfieldiae]
MSEPIGPTQQFYTRWARLYDLVAVQTPGIGSIRTAAVDLLDPQPGDTVVEMGCGSGANLSLLRDRVGPEGRVIGVDVSPGVLSVARKRVDRNGWTNVHIVRSDATQPPVDSADVDCLFASLVVAMFDAPAGVVDDWAELVGPGGRLGLMDLARSSHPRARVLNGLFRRFVTYANPRSVRQSTAPLSTLDRRVAAAHKRLHERCSDAQSETRALGFARLSAGTVD